MPFQKAIILFSEKAFRHQQNVRCYLYSSFISDTACAGNVTRIYT
jgi:hypothetical protein